MAQNKRGNAQLQWDVGPVAGQILVHCHSYHDNKFIIFFMTVKQDHVDNGHGKT